jgi:twinkle protein
MIVQPISLLDEVIDYKRHGLPKGCSTGWVSVDKHYRVAKSQWTLVTGMPQSGKSEWLDALMVNLAKQPWEGKPWQFGIFSPENAPLALHVSKILEKLTGKPFEAGPTEPMTEEEIRKGMDWMDKRFGFFKVVDPTLDSILAHVAEFAMVGRITRHTGVVIDPWNQVDHLRPSNMPETEYISQCLSRLIAFVREYDMHLWMVAHPRIMQRDKDGKRLVVTPYDVSGSAHWFNKADNCITIHRDLVEQSQMVEVHVQKVRFKHVGHIGLVDLRYDRVTGCYSDVVRSVSAEDYRSASGRPDVKSLAAGERMREPGEDEATA